MNYDRKQRVFISGPMTGYKNYNFEAFEKAEYDLSMQGYKVINPAIIGKMAITKYGKVERGDPVYLKLCEKCIELLKTCDKIVLLKGWEKSKGALNELACAIDMGIEVERYKPVIYNADRQMEFDFVQINDDKIVNVFNFLCTEAHANAKNHGWWEDDRGIGECIALMHSELSEALEYARKGNNKSDHIPAFSGVEEELADVLIRIFDFCGKAKFRLGEAVLAKMQFNKDRPYKHGKEF